MRSSPRRIAGVVAATIGIILSVVGVTAAPASANHNGQKYTICHRTNSDTNPYVVITPDESAVDGAGGKGDHYNEHQGPIWELGLKAKHIEWGDIIPPVPGHHAGLNWTDEGQAIHANGCKPTPAAPGANAVQCVGGVLGIRVTLTNTGTADAVFVVTQDGTNVGTADQLTVTGLEDVETISLLQTEDTPTTVTITSGGLHRVFSFNSDCSAAVNTPNPGANAVECGGPGQSPGITITLTNSGNADAIVDVTQGGAAVSGSPFTVTPGASVTVTLPQVEDTPTSIDVDSGAFHMDFDFQSNCAPPPPAQVAEPDVAAVQCQPGVVVTLSNGGGVAADFVVLLDSVAVAGSPFTVAGGAQTNVPLTQVEDDATTISVSSPLLVPNPTLFDFDSNCAGSPPPPPPPPPTVTNPVLSASAKCASGGQLVTITNTGDAVGTANVSNNGTIVGKVTVPANQSRTVLVPVVEDAAYDIAVSGVTGHLTGTSDCADVEDVVIPGPTQKPTVKPVITPVVSPTAKPVVRPFVTPVVNRTVKPEQVMGEVITRPRTLARTGSDSLPLLEVGLGLLLLGAGLTFSGRREQYKA